MIILYEHPLSPYAQKNKIALREKGVEFEIKTPDVSGGAFGGSEFLEANPRAQMPVLIDGDAKIFDSTIILEYIEDKWSEPPLLPPNPADRARVRMIEEVMDTYYEPINWGVMEINFFGRAKGSLAETIVGNAKQQAAKCREWLTKQLGDCEWFNGDRFGWSDLCVVPYINSSSFIFGIGPEANSPLADWFKRVSVRPSVAQTLQEANDSVAGLEQFSHFVEQGLFKREYRDHRLEWMIRMGGLQVVLDGIEKDNIRFSNDFS
ncbi:glutathione S-transferase family protein [Brasilonema octagenarum UFV-E1]|uniref:Glutathione S-transferase family protein n=2 Tax=Brasilonema TaxID=383614 RepID=A0A856MLA6_9CYAN|nr:MULTISPECIES: glutathione S-transferase family protein [Brasilonema]NMF66470.1 glutathione S-transferase family protein [Brasilonema octagenarum UFV-OR1]QDL10341.1 glutathione S-transferase family protein [Brasilonema sennae CENA114]QDL16688.1 glutathione S-transferase family protein [Brasilonema octagenarum UFV-E1]